MSFANSEEALGAADGRLRELVRRYAMSYRALPEWGADAHWNASRNGFAVELYAVPDPDRPPDEQSPTERVADRVPHAALREVLAFALEQPSGDVCVMIDDHVNRLVQESKANTWRAEIVAHVTHCDDVRRPLGEEAQRYLARIERRLAELGVHEA